MCILLISMFGSKSVGGGGGSSDFDFKIGLRGKGSRLIFGNITMWIWFSAGVEISWPLIDLRMKSVNFHSSKFIVQMTRHPVHYFRWLTSIGFKYNISALNLFVFLHLLVSGYTETTSHWMTDVAQTHS